MHRASRKKRLLNPNKSQLLFVEAPINGPKHDCGPQLRSAIHPRTFISEKQQRHDAPCTSWVSPQFTLQDIKAVSRERRKNHSGTRSKSNTATGLSLHHGRRSAVCKYNLLSFETNPAVSQHRHNNLQTNTAIQVAKEVRCPKVFPANHENKNIVETPKRTPSLLKVVKRSTATSVVRSVASRHTEISNIPPLHINKKRTSDGFVHTPVSNEGQTPNTTSVPAPTEVETPEMTHYSSTPLPGGLHLLFSPNQVKTPPQTEMTSVLVKDTPERDYGLRATWRRRKGLMKLLIDRGQLLQTDAEVANEWI